MALCLGERGGVVSLGRLIGVFTVFWLKLTSEEITINHSQRGTSLFEKRPGERDLLEDLR